MISETTRNAISSPGSAYGASRFDALGGMTLAEYGQALAPANLSARQVKELHLMMSGICGPLSIGSSRSAALQSSLVSRLQARLSSLGSTLYKLTWKPWVTPSGPSRFRLRASVRRTSETDFTGWLTPRARGDAGGQRWRTGDMRNLEDQARMYGLLCGLSPTEVAAMSLSATFCRRLMALPAEWDACAPTETLSTLKRRRNLSERT